MFVRVLEVRVPPGSVEPRHRHPHGLSVYLASQDTRITVDGQAPQVGHREAGSFAWSDAVVHTVQNVGATRDARPPDRTEAVATRVGAAGPGGWRPGPNGRLHVDARQPQNTADFIGDFHDSRRWHRGCS